MPSSLKVCQTVQGMNGEPVTIFECEHITAHTYRIAGDSIISTGDSTGILLCIHCMTHLRGQILAELMIDVLKQKSVSELMGQEKYEAMMDSLVKKMAP